MREIYNVSLNIVMSNPDKKIVFRFGGALGTDQFSFYVCEKIREKYPERVRLILCVPFKKQSSNWISKIDIDRYNHQVSVADEVIYVDTLPEYACNLVPVGEYHPAKMQLRNQYMVDHVNIVIAVWDGSSGGTGNCVRYARQKNKEIIRINPKTIDKI